MEILYKSSTKIPHFLDETGQIAQDLPAQARAQAEYLGEIIRAVSGSMYLSLCESIRCRNKISGKRCRGEIGGWTEDPTGSIKWGCHKCGDGGFIYDWQGTIFDETELRKKRELEHIRRGIWISGERLDEAKLSLVSARDGSASAWPAWGKSSCRSGKPGSI